MRKRLIWKKAVSYTHLDVYKRQVEERNLSVGEQIAVNFVYIVSILELANRRQKSDNEKMSGITRLPPVSYTHLIRSILYFLS